MSDAPDVRLLQTQDLPPGDFPGGKGQVFRVYFAPEVHEALWKHAAEDVSVEVCGVLVGAWERDAAGPFVRIDESIRGEAATSKFAEVTFTHETWANINQQMDTRFSHLAIVGWYHTHPDFGIFLSDRDRFIQEHFFANPGQVAHVIDPLRKTEGVFVWREGKPALAPHFWVGDRVVPGTAAGAEEPADTPGATGGSPTGGSGRTGTRVGNPPVPPATSSGIPPASRLMMYGAVFLLGFLLASRRSEWEQERLMEGVAAHVGIWKGLRPGLREELDLLDRDLAAIAAPMEARDARPADIPWREVRSRLAHASRRIAALKERYALTDREEGAIRQMLERVQVITNGREAGPTAVEKAKPDQEAGEPAPDAPKGRERRGP